MTVVSNQSVGSTDHVSFIDAVLLALFGVWFVQIVSGTQATFETSALGAPVLAFILWAIVAFVAFNASFGRSIVSWGGGTATGHCIHNPDGTYTFQP